MVLVIFLKFTWVITIVVLKLLKERLNKPFLSDTVPVVSTNSLEIAIMFALLIGFPLMSLIFPFRIIFSCPTIIIENNRPKNNKLYFVENFIIYF